MIAIRMTLIFLDSKRPLKNLGRSLNPGGLFSSGILQALPVEFTPEKNTFFLPVHILVRIPIPK